MTTGTLLSTGATTLCFHPCSTCHNFDFLKGYSFVALIILTGFSPIRLIVCLSTVIGVHHQVLNDLSFRDVVKNAVLISMDAHKAIDRDNSLELPVPVPKKIKTEPSSVNYIFKYLLGGVCYHTLRAPADCEHTDDTINKMDEPADCEHSRRTYQQDG